MILIVDTDAPPPVLRTVIIIMLLLYAFRDLWKEWGDSNFQIFFTELPVPPQAAGVVGPFLMCF